MLPWKPRDLFLVESRVSERTNEMADQVLKQGAGQSLVILSIEIINRSD